MVLIRTILIVVLTLTASLSGAMGMDHMSMTEHDHVAMESIADEGPVCCDESTERGQSCHVLPAVLADAGGEVSAPETSDALFFRSGLLLTGLDPSGPLDPPRHA
ncbi:hypothetical protein [uncultured Roseobacter sp.]|uniref:hypothetical protein n=1 Tax=uncultured Roseobacter sp. TaxID=114847 RepID=UPI0026367FFC|nr:hypothetical protein [uncultured Roseobacter sp.]